MTPIVDGQRHDPTGAKDGNGGEKRESQPKPAIERTRGFGNDQTHGALQLPFDQTPDPILIVDERPTAVVVAAGTVKTQVGDVYAGEALTPGKTHRRPPEPAPISIFSLNLLEP